VRLAYDGFMRRGRAQQEKRERQADYTKRMQLARN
jgi:hypothetical protein